MSQARFLMCAPEHYEVAYEINPWMSTRRHVDRALALRQWQRLYETLTGKLHAKVDLLEPVRGLPDMVFTANGGIVRKRLFVLSRFRHRERAAARKSSSRAGSGPMVTWCAGSNRRIVSKARATRFSWAASFTRGIISVPTRRRMTASRRT
jgi:hypothetical protein